MAKIPNIAESPPMYLIGGNGKQKNHILINILHKERIHTNQFGIKCIPLRIKQSGPDSNTSRKITETIRAKLNIVFMILVI
jgi:hypothetical protein